MATTICTQEELLSRAHIDAIVAQSGATCNYIDTDYGTDLEVRKIQEIAGGRRIDVGAMYDVQLKATVNWSYDGSYVKYDMESEAYNRLVERNKANTTIACFLVLCCLPKGKENWLLATEKRLCLRNCCYYKLVSGVATKNRRSCRIRIPRAQLLTPEATLALSENFSAGLVK